jgi:methyl-accepting chemotaxis protein
MFDESQGGVYRLLTWADSYGEARVKGMTTEILGMLDTATAELEKTAKNDTNPVSMLTIKAMLPVVRKYGKEVSQAIDMAGVDTATGLNMMQLADKSFQDITGKLRELEKGPLADVAKSYEDAKTTHSRAVMVAVVLLALAMAAAIGISVVLTRRIMAAVVSAKDAVSTVASGDLSRQIHVASKDELGEMLGLLETMRQNLRNMIWSICNSADQVSRSTGDLAHAAENVALASQSQSDNASSMAAAIEEFTVSINQMADNATQAHALRQKSGQVAQQGGAVIEDTVAELNKIASTVSDAARKLAECTAHSTEEVRQVVSSIAGGADTAVAGMQKAVTAVDSRVSLAARAGDSTREITTRADAMAEEVSAINAALKEQSAASNEIATRVERIAHMSEENSSSAQPSSGLARHLQELAQEMHGQMSRFRL